MGTHLHKNPLSRYSFNDHVGLRLTPYRKVVSIDLISGELKKTSLWLLTVYVNWWLPLVAFPKAGFCLVDTMMCVHAQIWSNITGELSLKCQQSLGYRNTNSCDFKILNVKIWNRDVRCVSAFVNGATEAWAEQLARPQHAPVGVHSQIEWRGTQWGVRGRPTAIHAVPLEFWPAWPFGDITPNYYLWVTNWLMAQNLLTTPVLLAQFINDDCKVDLEIKQHI